MPAYKKRGGKGRERRPPLEKKLKAFYATEKHFAHGAEAVVYRKRNYPTSSWFAHQGTIVKRYENETRGKVRRNFWAFKIAHELFPKNVPIVKGYRKFNNTEELHMDEVPIHRELENYQRQIRYRANLPASERHDFQLKEYAECEKALEKNTALKPLVKKMFDAGIAAYTSEENATNVSIANPKQPIILELGVYSPQKVLALIRDFPQSKKVKIAQYLERWEKAAAPAI